MRCIVKYKYYYGDKKDDTIRNGMDGGNTIAVIDGFRDGPLIRCFDLKSPFNGVMPNSSCYFRAVYNQIYSFSPQDVLSMRHASAIILAVPTFELFEDYLNHIKDTANYVAMNVQMHLERHVFVVQDEKMKLDLQNFLIPYSRNVSINFFVKSIYVLPTIREQYRQQMTQARESLVTHASSSIFALDSQTPLFNLIQDYVGSVDDILRDLLLRRCTNISAEERSEWKSNLGKSTWYDKLEMILQKYIINQIKNHDNDKDKFYSTPCGQQAEKLLAAFNKAGEFYSDGNNARDAYNKFVEVINDMVKNKVFDSSLNRLLNDNALHQYLEKLVEAFKPLKKTNYLSHGDGGSNGNGGGK